MEWSAYVRSIEVAGSKDRHFVRLMLEKKDTFLGGRSRRPTTRRWRQSTRRRTGKRFRRWSWTRRAAATASCGTPTTTATWASCATRRPARSSQPLPTPDPAALGYLRPARLLRWTDALVTCWSVALDDC